MSTVIYVARARSYNYLIGVSQLHCHRMTCSDGTSQNGAEIHALPQNQAPDQIWHCLRSVPSISVLPSMEGTVSSTYAAPRDYNLTDIRRRLCYCQCRRPILTSSTIADALGTLPAVRHPPFRGMSPVPSVSTSGDR